MDSDRNVPNLCLHSLVFPDPRVLLSPTTIADLRDMGYSGIEVIPDAFSNAELERLKVLCDQLGLRILVGWSLGPEHNLVDADPTVVAAGVAHMKKLVTLCTQLNAPILAGLNYAGTGCLTGQPSTRPEWNRAVSAYREICDHALQQSGPLLCLEPATREDSHLVNTVEQGLAFLDDVGRDNAALLLDTFQMLREENDVGAAIRFARGKIGYVHVSESHRGTPGTGTVPWDDVASALVEVGYGGWLGVEAFFDVYAPVARRAKIWRQMEVDAPTLAKRAMEHIHRIFTQVSRENSTPSAF